MAQPTFTPFLSQKRFSRFDQLMEAANITVSFYENGEFEFCYFGEIIKAKGK